MAQGNNQPSTHEEDVEPLSAEEFRRFMLWRGMWDGFDDNILDEKMFNSMAPVNNASYMWN